MQVGHLKRYTALLLLLLLLLAGCEIEGGAPRPSTPGVLPPTATVAQPSPTPQPVVEGFRIGLIDEPGDLLPYHDDAADQRVTAPVSEMLFPSPLLASSYTYTTTGVLERVPSFENGDIELRQIDVYVDAAGEVVASVPESLQTVREFTVTLSLTTTGQISPTETLTATEQLSPTTSDSLTATGEVSPTGTLTATGEVSPTGTLTATDAVSLTVAATGTQQAAAEPTLAQRIAEMEAAEQSQEITGTEIVSGAHQVVVTYRWNPALRWSDGEPVTADDSVFAYQLAKTKLLGQAAYERSQFIERYERVDATTTRAFFYPEFFDEIRSDLTDPSYIQTSWTPLPRHLLAEATATDLAGFARTPTGYGPYMVVQREPGRIKLQRNPSYYGTTPHEETVTVVFLPGLEVLRTSVLAGTLDVAVSDDIAPDQFDFLRRDEDLGLLEVRALPSPIWEHLDFNLDVRLFQDIRVRQAIAHGTNRQAMVNQLFHGTVPVLDSWIVPEHWAAAPPDQLTRYPYDPARANELLDEVTILDSDGDGEREPMTVDMLITDQSPLRTRIAEMFKDDMAAIGIAVNVQAVPIQELNHPDGPLYRRQFHLAQFAWIATPIPAGLSLWGCRSVPSEQNNWTGNNFSGWCFYDADQAIRKATTVQSETARLEAYHTQQQLFTQELPSLPLFQRPDIILSRPDIRHLQPDPVAPITWNIPMWVREEQGAVVETVVP